MVSVIIDDPLVRVVCEVLRRQYDSDIPFEDRAFLQKVNQQLHEVLWYSDIDQWVYDEGDGEYLDSAPIEYFVCYMAQQIQTDGRLQPYATSSWCCEFRDCYEDVMVTFY